MDPKTLEALYEKILRLTQHQAIRWEMQDDGSILANFSRSSVDLEKDFNTEPTTYRMNIYNENGVVVAHIADDEHLEYPEEVAYLNRDVTQLYQLASSQIYKYEDTANDLLAELEKLEKKVSTQAP